MVGGALGIFIGGLGRCCGAGGGWAGRGDRWGWSWRSRAGRRPRRYTCALARRCLARVRQCDSATRASDVAHWCRAASAKVSRAVICGRFNMALDPNELKIIWSACLVASSAFGPAPKVGPFKLVTPFPRPCFSVAREAQ